MGAWRLRAIVYGLLVVVSALVLWQSGALAGDPPRPRTLHGRTAQGSPLELTTRDGELVSFDTGRIESRCGKPGFAVAGPWAVSRWYPAIGQANVTYAHHGTAFQVHERPDPRFGDVRQRVNLYMRASFGAGGRIAGRIWYTAEPGGIHCETGLIAFSAHP